MPEIKQLIAQNEAQLKIVDGVVDPSLAENVAALMGKVRQIGAKARVWKTACSPAAKPKAERNVKDSQAWYEAVGAVAIGLTDVSRSIAGEARLADPVIGEYVLARQYSWSARDSFGTECSVNRPLFVNKTPIDAKGRLPVAAPARRSGRSLASLDDLLSRERCAARPHRSGGDRAGRVVSDAYAKRDAAYADAGTAQGARHAPRGHRCATRRSKRSSRSPKPRSSAWRSAPKSAIRPRLDTSL